MSAKIKVTWDDVKAYRAAKEGGRIGLLECAEFILEASNQVVPLEGGELMGSGAVDFDFDAGTASVYYETVYAVRLHQNPGFAFQNGRRGKWLHQVVRQGARRATEVMAEGMRARFRR